MKLTVELTAQEQAAIHGWVNYYREHPEKVGTPNQWRLVLDSRSQARFAEIEAHFYSTSPVPPPLPPTSGTLAAFFARQAAGQWRAYCSSFFTESGLLQQAYPHRYDDVSRILGFYGPGGPGNVSGERRADGTYWFWKYVNGEAVVTKDENGAADAHVQANCAASGMPYMTLTF